MGKLFWLLIAVGCLGAAPAWALSADQVLQLKKAGVSEAVIQKIIDTEMAQAGGGRLGRYVLRQSGGREVIVYQAQSGAGAQEYPLEMDPAWHDSQGLRVILGRRPRGDVVAVEQRQEVSQALAGARGQTKTTPSGRYTLLLESHRELAPAEKRAKQLSAEGIEARVESVDLGGQGRWYRVLHGRFGGREQAEGQGDKLRQAGGIGSYTVLAR
ncbi:MAG: SPOR domain-containing protein [Desulfarculus sp.]|nr:SPOR domain-containing protein [Desulfarculus sp.]